MADNCLREDANGGKIVPKGRAKTPEPPCDVLQIESRQSFIDHHVGRVLDDLFNDSLYWNMPSGGTEPLFVEMRDAIMAKLFAEQHEQGRQELHAEQVRDNCI